MLEVQVVRVGDRFFRSWCVVLKVLEFFELFCIFQQITKRNQCNYLHSVSYLLTYLLTPWSKFLLEKLTGSQLVK